MQSTYTIIISQSGTIGICCLRCGNKSYNPNDIINLYCDHCQGFHEPIKDHKYVLVNNTPVACPDVLVWAQWFEAGGQNSIVKQQHVGKYFVSTAFLSLDSSFRGSQPRLFETAIFTNWPDEANMVWCKKNALYETAEETHTQAVKLAESALKNNIEI